MSAAQDQAATAGTSGVLGGARLAPPTFSSPAEERAHLKVRLAAAFRLFAFYGFDEGAAGHITARDPERPDHFWVNPFGRHFACLTPKDLLLVNHGGKWWKGKGW